ncbi:MAG: Rne/Rng family ribonuclease [Prochlorococcus marinus subsp. pastoris]|nr:MAG: ribonuclease E/G [Prochlorococcus sp. MED-G72]
MSQQIVIAEQARIAALLTDDQVDELIVAQGQYQIGDIFLGTVENVLPGIDAAFIDIGESEKNGFIHVSDLGPLRLKKGVVGITELLEPKQKVLVQVMKEPTGNKGPRLTGNISLPGKYLVLQPYGQGVNISRKINTETERSRLRALGVLIKPPSTGLLFRTEAEQIKEELLIEDLENLIQQWDQVLKNSESTHPPNLISRDEDFSLKILRDCIKSSTNKIVIDNNIALEKAKDFLVNNDSKVELVFHNNEINEHILEKYQINKTIQKALQPRVDLPSGGYIIIEPTEALTVIDVNSGSFTRSANSRQTVLWTNCEAAIEISRQMKLRNIGGVLVIDFIDMESRRDQFQLLEHFTLAIKDDSARPQIAQLTELGLVELTRKRQGQNIYELFGTKCSNCNGLGHIENLPNYKNNSLKTNQNAKKSSKINDTKIPDLTPIQLIENQETITREEFTKTRNTNKDDDNSNKRRNDNEVSNSNNRREKKVITVELSNDEKIVYSQLGINPLIKLGKEYLSSNHLVRLEDAKNKEKTASEQNVKTNNKVSSKKSNKITSTFDSKEEVEADYPKEVNPDKKLPKVTNENEEIETKDEIDNSRRKRRRSSANIE